LTIANPETAATLTVTAKVSYDGAERSGTATVTIISAQAQGEAIAAIASATDAQAVLAALKAPDTGIDPHKIVDAWAAEYLTGKAAFSAATTAEAANTALDTLNKSIALTKVNTAATADGVRAAILNEAAFTALGDDGTYWGQYSSLSAADKTSVATALVGQSYATINALLAALQTAIAEKYFAERPITYTIDGGGSNPPAPVPGDPGGDPIDTYIDFIFSAPVTGLTLDDITISGDASIEGETMLRTREPSEWDTEVIVPGTEWWLGPLTVARTGSVTVSINKAGIESGSKTIEVELYYTQAGPTLTYTAEQVGGETGSTNTTGIKFTFGWQIEWVMANLTAAEIAVSGAASKGESPTLAQPEYDEEDDPFDSYQDWMQSLILSPVTVSAEGNATVSIAKTGIEVGSKNVAVYKASE
jgi:hypothetical protein